MLSSQNRLLLILALATLIRLPFVFLTPAWQAPDEYPHFHYIRTLAEAGKFPISRPQFPDYEAYQPPLYYLIGAGLFKITASWRVPEEPQDISHIEPDSPLAVIALRLLSLMLGVATVYLAYRVGQQVFPHNAVLAFALPIMLALHPTFVSNTTSITNDALANLVGALLVWISVQPTHRAITSANQTHWNKTEKRAQRRPASGTKIAQGFFFANLSASVSWRENFFYKDFILIGLLGISLGVAFLTKHNLLPLAVLVPLMLWHWKKSVKTWLQQLMPIFAIALLVSGWYYQHNLRQYGNLFAINPGVETEFSALVWDWPRWLQVIRNYNWSFWCAFGRTYEIHLPAWFYLIFFLPLTLLVLYGAGRAVFLRFHAKRVFAGDDIEKLASSFPRREATQFFLFGFFIYVVAALGYTASYPLNCAWGKYVFPFLIPIWSLMLSSLHVAAGQKFLKFIVVFLAVSFIFINMVMLEQLARLQN